MGWARAFAALAKRAARAVLAGEVRIHVPCQVVSYTALTNLVSVQPCINVIRTEDPNNLTSAQLPVIDDVPVRQFGSGKCLLSIAPQADSYGVLHVSDRALERWITLGGLQDPSSSKKFDMSSAFFEPGVYPILLDGDNGLIVPPIDTDRVALRNRLNSSYVAVTDAGVVEIGAGSVISTPVGTITIAIDGKITIANSVGTWEMDAAGNIAINGSADYAVAYTDLKTAFDTLKGDFNTFVTTIYNLHNHPTAPVGPVSVPSVVGTSSAADMSAAQVATVKLP
jgi:hypothetical protein